MGVRPAGCAAPFPASKPDRKESGNGVVDAGPPSTPRDPPDAFVPADASPPSFDFLVPPVPASFDSRISFSLSDARHPVAVPYAVIVADVDRNGWLDFAAPIADGVMVFTNSGTQGGLPSFSLPLWYGTAGSGPVDLKAADFDSDGRPDLVTVTQGGDTVEVFLGTGRWGSFEPPIAYKVGRLPYKVDVGDIDGDSRPDLVVSNYNDSFISILTGNGDGTFQDPTSVSTPHSPRAVTIIPDLDGDGIPDVAVTMADNSILFFSKRLQDMRQVPCGSAPQNAIVHGGMTLFVSHRGEGTVGRLALPPGGNFTVEKYATGGQQPEGLAVADLNGDGKDDLVVANEGSHTLSVLYGDGLGGYTGQILQVLPAPHAVAIADFNRDGRLDIVYTTLQGAAEIRLNTTQ